MLAWQWTRFEALSGADVYDLLALRGVVFVLEQQCAYLDPDGLDRHAWHLLGRDRMGGGALIAYLRVVDAGQRHAVPSLGRVVVAPARRGAGLGHALVAEALRRIDAHWPGQANHISAQAHLQDFYAVHGYVAVGTGYLEDGISHVGMIRVGAARQNAV